MRKFLFFFVSVLLMVFLVSAVDFIPQGDIEGLGIRNIQNFTNITSYQLCDFGGFCSNVSNLASGGASGDITAVLTPDNYLLGGATSGSVSLTVNQSFLNSTIDDRAVAGSGSANCSVSGSCSSVVYTTDLDNGSIIRTHNTSWILANQGYNSTEEIQDAMGSVLDGPQSGILVEYVDLQNYWQFTLWANITRDAELDNSTVIRTHNTSWITSNQNNLYNTSQQIWDNVINGSVILEHNISWITSNQDNLYNSSQEIWDNVINGTLIQEGNVSWITANQNNLYNSSFEMIASTTGSVNSTSWDRTGTTVILANTGDSLGVGTVSPGEKLTVSGSYNLSSSSGRECYSNATCSLICTSSTTKFTVCD